MTKTKRGHLTATEKKQIRKMTLDGVRQAEIARALGITAPSVSKAQRVMGLPTRLVWPEAKILKLFKRGWGGHRISKHLSVPVNQVYAVARKNNFRRADAVGYPTPPENVARFLEAVKNREDYVRNLAAKYSIGICKAYRLARQVLSTPRFRPGRSKPVLSSDFPQKHFTKKIGQR